MTARRIAITGASRGLGAELARQLAAPDVSLLLCARDISNLNELTSFLTKRGAFVDWTEVDVSKTEIVSDWIDKIWDQAPLDMLILNAGIYDGRGPDGKLETPEQAAKIIETNLVGAISPTLASVERMRRHGSGHLVFISSLASLTPHADAPSYSASKAGVTAFAQALRESLAETEIKVSIIHAGHIDTDQTAQHVGPLPGKLSPQMASRRILRGIARGQSEISFPVSLRIGIGLLRLLPWRLQVHVNKPFRFRVRPPISQSDKRH